MSLRHPVQRERERQGEKEKEREREREQERQQDIQGGRDASSFQVISCKRALQLVALLPRITCNLRRPIGLRHPGETANPKEKDTEREIERDSFYFPNANRTFFFLELIVKRPERIFVQGGQDPQDAFSCMSFFEKEPMIIGLFRGK